VSGPHRPLDASGFDASPGISDSGQAPALIDLSADRALRTVEDFSGGLLHASRLRLGSKRGMDLVGALLALVVLSPILLAVSASLLVSSGPPILYAQQRVGRGGRSFRILKFRTMRHGSHALMDEYWEHNELDGPIFKMRSDPRVTAVGRLLRKYSVDELPQLVNVLLGQMSLVGPRPLVPEEYASLGNRELQRLLVRPGITGLWQVSGRNDVDFRSWMDLDLEYIRTWSLRSDVRILLRTIPAVLTARGSY
jgi:lipopolysaccharide/colanic/teichoic acid biosynthesis glycosyltransferase